MPIELRHGVLHRDGAPELLATADYPYYRDHPSVWRERLTALRDRTGIRVVTCYLPWRYHQPDPAAAPDFTDAVRFLRLCGELGLDVIAKPGPFIHAETNYGGLPDWICPLNNPEVEPALRADGEPMRWNGSLLDEDGTIARWPLPSPVGPHFTARVLEWLRAVGKEVLAELTGPDGPVIAVQIANEGLFTDGALPLWVYDYSEPALAAFRDGLDRHYGGVDGYNAVHGLSLASLAEVRPPRRRGPLGTPGAQLALADWGRFHSELLGHCYRTWYDALGTDVPVLVNLNPPAGDPHSFDDWLARVRPENWPGIHYGFTNWMGVVSTDPLAHARYVVAAKRAPGPNMEENWGFSELYDRAYAAGATSLHQTLLAVATGATGWNVYTGIATATWSDDLDVLHHPPYPDCPPVDAEGRTGHKAFLVRALADWFARHGGDFLAAAPAVGGTWGLYSPYAAVAAWSTDDPAGSTACGRPLRAFHDRLRAAGLDYRLTDLEHADSLDGPVHLHGGPFMSARVQRLLADHLAAGNAVQLDGPVPLLDDRLQPCTILADALADVPGAGPAVLPPPPARVLSGRADAFWRSHGDVGYLTVLVQSDNDGPVVIDLQGRRVTVESARGGAALLRLVDGELDDFLVLGSNAFLGSLLTPSLTVGDRTWTAPHPGDHARIGGVVRSFEV